MSNKQNSSSKEHTNIYDTVTDRILDSLNNGIVPWQKPWSTATYEGGNFPRNFQTGRTYRGVNILLLWSAPFTAPFWLTYKQAREMGGSVRKGEKGTQIVFYKQLQGKKDENARTEEEQSKRSPFVLTHYTVFNVEQCDGLVVPEKLPVIEPDDMEIDGTCEALVSAWEGRPTMEVTRIGEQRAYYRPATDTVHMPARFRFLDPAFYHSTLFHELAHSTGHETRLNRTFGSSFGDDLYSKEELVAEMGSAFLCAFAGIANEHTDRNTTAYLQNWIAKLQADNRLVLHAAAAAQKAVDMITGHEAPQEQPA